MRGFYFFAKLLVFCALLASVGYVGLPWVERLTRAPEVVPVQVAAAVERAPGVALSSTTPKRIINALSIKDAVPQEGKFIAADLGAMQVYLYENGTTTAQYPILTKGKPGTPWETPSGFYAVQTKEENHFSTIGSVNMPYSMQFYGNYFIHGWPTYRDGTPVASTFSGGCIRLSTADAAEIFAFADKGTGLFVFDAKQASTSVPLVLAQLDAPLISAEAYLVADIDSGDVYLERNADRVMPIASVTKLMTALVASEIISFEKEVPTVEGELSHTNASSTNEKKFFIGDLLYPLLMESNNHVADMLARFYGTGGFVEWMNTTAKALGMESTRFADPSGISPYNKSTPDDLFRLAMYLANKKSFVWDITRTPTKTIKASDGTSYTFQNLNIFSGEKSFVGGKVGQTTAAGETMVSVFTMQHGTEKHRVATVVLRSNDYTEDTKKLTQWLGQAVAQGKAASDVACVGCAFKPEYRKIEF